MSMKPWMPALVLVLAVAAPAASRESAAYTLTAEAVDFGGTRSTSADYAIDGSLDSSIGAASEVVSAIVARHGYVGQLYDTLGHGLSATDFYPSELGTTRVFPVASLDDGTSLVLPAAGVTFSVLEGPLASVAPDGTVTAAAVHQHTAARVRAVSPVFSGPLELTLHVQDVLSDNFGLYAGDALADAWQVQYFGVGNLQAQPAADPDGDGQNNRFEFKAGLDPTDPTSVLRVRLEGVAGQPFQRRIVFGPVFPERTYAVKTKSSLNDPTWQPLDSSESEDQFPERAVTDLSAGGPQRFYIIEVEGPP